MTFEAILPELKKGAKIIRKGWGGYEEYVKYIPETTIEGVTMTPYFVIMVKGEGYSMFQPTVCDILAEDWMIVND
ncbi:MULTISPECIES: DUF2829 domain-containing protein [Globicatella]|uniref:Thoeris anti-defense 2-like domain-containing protein n=2 Tax=Globicatella sulfidifaciens TaxID=136093 RepID=A0A1T4KLY7_9LACT|nr:MULTISPECIES: DUF2829 domain-containing protein [Globicatella]MDT2769177.1 DUF2829 domain-containing protein [Globicatella sulfidifaciens]NLJ19417.1 DUF2829 domain-containing protein [Globicatella sulfidifaciens]OFK61080.1 hypothetical protein HMPREF2811_03245 [Globicatella sp. HMSC072A10]WPC08376.1 DUF2829 domain-containing protein [Globicatella sp. PHS-GS-PNBC-21-1553]SJZ43415.1 Protein of unknown function [Globicatella sulfidifaciens DSM 15739]